MRRYVATRTRSARTSRSRPLAFEQIEQRLLLTAGVVAASGWEIQSPGHAASEVVEATPSARVRLELNDLAGQAITSVQAGEEFILNAYVADLRSEPLGVFAAYLDLSFDADRIVPAGGVEFGPQYPNGPGSAGAVPGLLDEVGGFSGSYRPIGAGDFLLFRAPFRAETAGTVSFVAEPASLAPDSYMLLYGAYEPLAKHKIDFRSASVEILEPRDSSLENPFSLAAAFLSAGNSDVQVSLRDDASQFVALLRDAVPAWGGGDWLFGSTTLASANSNPLHLQTNRVSDHQIAYDFLDLGIGLAGAFDFATRNHDLEWMLGASSLSMERTPGMPGALRFSLREPPNFLLDRYEPRSFSDPVGDARPDAPARRSSLFHDGQWLTVGLLRIGWRGEQGHGGDAEMDPMFDLARIAYETLGSTRVPELDELRIGDEEEEWITGLDGVFSEETEVDGVQGTLMAVEADVLADRSVRRETSSRPDSGEAAPTESRTTGTKENPDRPVKDDHTPAA